MMMEILLSLLPIDLLQTYQSVSAGDWSARSPEFMQTDVIVLSILLYAFLGKGADSLVKLLERWQLAWRPALQGPQ